MNLDRILEAARTLTPDEQLQLRAQLDKHFAQPKESGKVHAFHRALLALGLVKTITVPRAGATGKRRLIEVKGRSLSETIVAEQ